MAEGSANQITFGILSLLEGEPYRQVREIWKYLEEKYGLVAVQAFPHPHLSFQGGVTCCVEEIAENCQWLLDRLDPIDIEVTGLGHFGDRVIYLEVKPTPNLRQVNRLVNEYLAMRCQSLFPLYTPQQWVPHITLAVDDLTEDIFERVWSDLSRSPLVFQQTLHSLCLVGRQDHSCYTIVREWRLGR